MQGKLHISGRIKDTIVINGRNYQAHDMEECVQRLDGIRRGGVVAFGRPVAGSEQLVLVTESRSAMAKEALQHALRATVHQRLGLAVADVFFVGHGIIARTSSGKIKRQALKVRYLAGEFAAMSPPPGFVRLVIVNGHKTIPPSSL